MAERDRPHLILRSGTSTESFTSVSRGGPSKVPPSPSSRIAHGDKLTQQMAAAIALAEDRRTSVEPIAGAAVSGVYVQFESLPGFELALDPLGSHEPELRAVTTFPGSDGDVQVATVFVPDGTVGRFLRRFADYAADQEIEKPPNQALVERIDQIRLATVRALWTDHAADFPDENEVVWWEMWLRSTDGVTDRLKTFAERVGAQIGSQRMVFDDRLIVLVRANAGMLADALDVLDDVAELRRPTEIAQEIDALPAADQAEFVDYLTSRVEPPVEGAPRLCLLDTGVAAGHPLIAPALSLDDLHVVDPSWSGADARNHGTGMASIALYGNVGAALLGSERIELPARLESVKILPDKGENDRALYGAITATAVSLVEIQNPEAHRAFVLAVTGQHGVPGEPAGLGEPTLWSATVDALAAGRQISDDDAGLVYLDESEDQVARLFIVSAGNVRHPYEVDHLAHSDTSPTEEPAQAWNALVVGAMTAYDHAPTEPVFAGATPLAARGDLSPFSRTSVNFDGRWRISPDVVFEGGNAALTPDGVVDTPPSLQVLTASEPSTGSLLTTMTGTSPATAAGAHLYAQLRLAQPDLRAETLRALIVSSARWTDRMAPHMAAGTVDARLAVLRRYGWGVPDLARAQHSATDALTLIAERTIHPYAKGNMREMHVHDLPWPVAELADLGDTEVRLRVALSYFIEPNPSRRGWTGRYRYASHGLRFAVRRATESDEEMRARINKDARTEGVAHDATETGNWIIGPQKRHVGSLHIDEWSGSAAELAARGSIVVFPVGGWWKENPKRDQSENGVNYSLVVTIETPDIDTDIWTPVAQQIGIDVSSAAEITVQIET